MDELRLRDAVPGDLEQIVAIYNASIPGRRVTADLEPVTVEQRRAWFDGHGAHRPLWVLEAPGASVAAWLSFEDFHERRAYARTAEVSVYVDEAHQGKGLGRRLLQAAIDTAPELDLAVLVGLIFGHNEPSLRLFAAHGFERWAHLPRVAELDGDLRDLVIVGREL
jgi:L-amino acid N-acyltransferase YncA